jgi:hypothetical protein
MRRKLFDSSKLQDSSTLRITWLSSRSISGVPHGANALAGQKFHVTAETLGAGLGYCGGAAVALGVPVNGGSGVVTILESTGLSPSTA